MIEGVAVCGQFVVLDGLPAEIPLLDVPDALPESVTALPLGPRLTVGLGQQRLDAAFVFGREPLDAVELRRQRSFGRGDEGTVVPFDDSEVDGLLPEHLSDDRRVWLALDVLEQFLRVERSDRAEILGVLADLSACLGVHESVSYSAANSSWSAVAMARAAVATASAPSKVCWMSP